MANNLVMEIESILEAIHAVDNALSSLGEKQKIVLDIETKWGTAGNPDHADMEAKTRIRDTLMQIVSELKPEFIEKLRAYEQRGFKVDRVKPPETVRYHYVDTSGNVLRGTPNESSRLVRDGGDFRPIAKADLSDPAFNNEGMPRLPEPAMRLRKQIVTPSRIHFQRVIEDVTDSSNRALFQAYGGQYGVTGRFHHDTPIFGRPTPPPTRTLPPAIATRAPARYVPLKELTDQDRRDIARQRTEEERRRYQAEAARYTPWDVYDDRRKQAERQQRRMNRIASGSTAGNLPKDYDSFDFNYSIVADSFEPPAGIPKRQLFSPGRGVTADSINKVSPGLLGQIKQMLHSVSGKLQAEKDPVGDIIKKILADSTDINGILDSLEYAVGRMASSEPGSSYYDNMLATLEDRGTVDLNTLARIVNQLQSAAARAASGPAIKRSEVREGLRQSAKVFEITQAAVKTADILDDDQPDAPYDVRLGRKPTYFRALSTFTGINSLRTSIGHRRASNEDSPQGADIGKGAQVAGFQTSQLLGDGRDEFVYGIMKRIHDQAMEDQKSGSLVAVPTPGGLRQVPSSLMRSAATYARSARQLSEETTHRGRIGESRGPLGVIQSSTALEDYGNLYGSHLLSTILSGGSFTNDSLDSFALGTVYSGSQEQSSTGLSIYAAKLRERLVYLRESERRRLATATDPTLVPRLMNEIAQITKQLSLFDEIINPATSNSRRGEIVFPRSVEEKTIIPLTTEQALSAMLGSELSGIAPFPDMVATVMPQAQQASQGLSAAGVASHGRSYVQGTALSEVFRRLRQGAPAKSIKGIEFPDYGGGGNSKFNYYDAFRNTEYATTGSESKGMQGILSEMFGLTNGVPDKGTFLDSIFHASRAVTGNGQFKSPEELRKLPFLEHTLDSIFKGADDLSDIGSMGLPILDFASLATRSRNNLEETAYQHIIDQMPMLATLDDNTLQRLSKISRDQRPARIVQQVVHAIAPHVRRVISRVISDKAIKSGMSSSEYQQMLQEYRTNRTVPRGFEELFKQFEFWDESSVLSNPDFNNALQLLENIPTQVYKPGDTPSSLMARLTGNEGLLTAASRMSASTPEISAAYGLQNTARDLKENALGRPGSNMMARGYSSRAALGPMESELRVRDENIKKLRVQRDAHPVGSPMYQELYDLLMEKTLDRKKFYELSVQPERAKLGEFQEFERLRLFGYLAEHGDPNEKIIAIEALAVASAIERLLGPGKTFIGDETGYTGTQRERYGQALTRQQLIDQAKKVVKRNSGTPGDAQLLNSLRAKLFHIEGRLQQNREIYEGTHLQDLASFAQSSLSYDNVSTVVAESLRNTALGAAVEAEDRPGAMNTVAYSSTIPLDHLEYSALDVSPRKAGVLRHLNEAQIMELLNASPERAARVPIIRLMQDINEATRSMEYDRAARLGVLPDYVPDTDSLKNTAYALIAGVHGIDAVGSTNPTATVKLMDEIQRVSYPQTQKVSKYGTKYGPETLKKAQEVVSRLVGKEDMTTDEQRQLSVAQNRLHAHNVRMLAETYPDNAGLLQLFDIMLGMKPANWDKTAEGQERGQIVRAITQIVDQLDEKSIQKLAAIDFTSTGSLRGLINRNPDNESFKAIVQLLGAYDTRMFEKFGSKKGARSYALANLASAAATSAIDMVLQDARVDVATTKPSRFEPKVEIDPSTLTGRELAKYLVDKIIQEARDNAAAVETARLNTEDELKWANRIVRYAQEYAATAAKTAPRPVKDEDRPVVGTSTFAVKPESRTLDEFKQEKLDKALAIKAELQQAVARRSPEAAEAQRRFEDAVRRGAPQREARSLWEVMEKAENTVKDDEEIRPLRKALERAWLDYHDATNITRQDWLKRRGSVPYTAPKASDRVADSVGGGSFTTGPSFLPTTLIGDLPGNVSTSGPVQRLFSPNPPLSAATSTVKPSLFDRVRASIGLKAAQVREDEERAAKLKALIADQESKINLFEESAEGLPLKALRFLATIPEVRPIDKSAIPLIKGIGGIDVVMEKIKEGFLGEARYSRNQIAIDPDKIIERWEADVAARAAGKPVGVTDAGIRMWQPYARRSTDDPDTARKRTDYSQFKSGEEAIFFVLMHELGHMLNKRFAGEDTGPLEDRVNEVALKAVAASRGLAPITAAELRINPRVPILSNRQEELTYETPDIDLRRTRLQALTHRLKQLSLDLSALLHIPFESRPAPRVKLDGDVRPTARAGEEPDDSEENKIIKPSQTAKSGEIIQTGKSGEILPVQDQRIVELFQRFFSWSGKERNYAAEAQTGLVKHKAVNDYEDTHEYAKLGQLEINRQMYDLYRRRQVYDDVSAPGETPFKHREAPYSKDRQQTRDAFILARRFPENQGQLAINGDLYDAYPEIHARYGSEALMDLVYETANSLEFTGDSDLKSTPEIFMQLEEMLGWEGLASQYINNKAFFLRNSNIRRKPQNVSDSVGAATPIIDVTPTRSSTLPPPPAALPPPAVAPATTAAPSALKGTLTGTTTPPPVTPPPVTPPPPGGGNPPRNVTIHANIANVHASNVTFHGNVGGASTTTGVATTPLHDPDEPDDSEAIDVRALPAAIKRLVFADLETDIRSDNSVLKRMIYQAAYAVGDDKPKVLYAGPTAYAASMTKVAQDTTLSHAERFRQFTNMALHDEDGNKIDPGNVNREVLESMFKYAEDPRNTILTQKQIERELQTAILNASAVVGHNFEQFDLPTIFRDMVPGSIKTLDTLTTVQGLYPGSHKLGTPRGAYNVMTGKMFANAHLADADVEATRELYKALTGGTAIKTVESYLKSAVSPEGYPFVQQIVDTDPSRMTPGTREHTDAIEMHRRAGQFYQSLAKIQSFVTGYKFGDDHSKWDEDFGYKKMALPGYPGAAGFKDAAELQAFKDQLQQKYLTPNQPYAVDGEFKYMSQFIGRRLHEKTDTTPFGNPFRGIGYNKVLEYMGRDTLDPAMAATLPDFIAGTQAAPTYRSTHPAITATPAATTAPAPAPTSSTLKGTLTSTPATPAPAPATPPPATPAATGMSVVDAEKRYNDELAKLQAEKDALGLKTRNAFTAYRAAGSNPSSPEFAAFQILQKDLATAVTKYADFTTAKDQYIAKLTTPPAVTPAATAAPSALKGTLTGTTTPPPATPPPATPPPAGGTPPPPSGPPPTPPSSPPPGGGNPPRNVTIHANIANVHAPNVTLHGNVGGTSTTAASPVFPGSVGTSGFFSGGINNAGGSSTLPPGIKATPTGIPDPSSTTASTETPIGMEAKIHTLNAQHVTIQVMGGDLHVAGEVGSVNGSGIGGSGGPRYSNRVQSLLSYAELNRASGAQELQRLNLKEQREPVQQRLNERFGAIAQEALSGQEFEKTRTLLGIDAVVAAMKANPLAALAGISQRGIDISTEQATLAAIPKDSLTTKQLDRLNELNQVNSELTQFIQLVKELSNALQRTVSAGATRPEYGYAGTEFDPDAPRGRAYGSDPTARQVENYRNSFQMQALRAYRNSYDLQRGVVDSVGFGPGQPGTAYGSRMNLIEMTKQIGVAGQLNANGTLENAVTGAQALGLKQVNDVIGEFSKIKDPKTSLEKVSLHISSLMTALDGLRAAAEGVAGSSTSTEAEVKQAASVIQNLNKVQQQSAGAIGEVRQTGSTLEIESNKRLADLRENLQANAGRQSLFGFSAQQIANRRKYLQTYVDRTVGKENRDLFLQGGTILGRDEKGRKINLAAADDDQLLTTQKYFEDRNINVGTDELFRLRRELQQEQQTKNQTQMANPLMYLTSKARDIQYWVQGFMSLPDTMTGMLEQATSPALGSIRTMTTARALSLTPETYKNALGAATTQQQLYGGSLSKNMASVTSFIPIANAYGVDINKTVSAARKLAAFDPAQGMEGASIAIKEFLSGNVSSLSRRFEINRSALTQINSGDANEMLDNLDKLLAGMGVTDRLIDEQASSLATKYDKMLGRLEMMQQHLSMSVVDVLSPYLDAVLGPQSALSKYLISNTINNPLKESVKQAGDHALTNIEDGTDNLNGLNLATFDFFDNLDTILSDANQAILKQAVAYEDQAGVRITPDMYKRLDNLNESDKTSFQINTLSNLAKGMTQSQSIINALTESQMDFANYQQFAGYRTRLGSQGATQGSLNAAVGKANREVGNLQGIKVRVIEINDADTVRVIMPDGSKEYIRTFGIDAPEKQSTAGKEATKSFTKMLADADNYIYLNRGYGKDLYDRSLYSYSFADSEGRNSLQDVGARLLSEGYATMYDVGGGDPGLLSRYANIEMQTADLGIGPVNADAAAAGLGGLPVITDEARSRSFWNRYGPRDMLGTAAIGGTLGSSLTGIVQLLMSATAKGSGLLAGMGARVGLASSGIGAAAAPGLVAAIAGAALAVGSRLAYVSYVDANDASYATMADRYAEQTKLQQEQERSGIIGRGLRAAGTPESSFNAINTDVSQVLADTIVGLLGGKEPGYMKDLGQKTFGTRATDPTQPYNFGFFETIGNYLGAVRDQVFDFYKDSALILQGPAAGAKVIEDSVKLAFEDSYLTTGNERMQQFEKMSSFSQGLFSTQIAPSLDAPGSKRRISVYEDTTQLKALYAAVVNNRNMPPDQQNKALEEFWKSGNFDEKLRNRMIPEFMMQNPANERLLKKAVQDETKVGVLANRDEQGRVLSQASSLAAYGINLDDFRVQQTVTPEMINDYLVNEDPFHFADMLATLKKIDSEGSGTYLEEAKKFLDLKMEQKQQLRMTRFTNLTESAGLMAFTGAITNEYVTPSSSPETRALSYLRGSSIDPSGSGDAKAGEAIGKSVTEQVKMVQLAADVFYEQAQTTYKFDAQYKSTARNFLDSMERAGEDFDTIKKTMGQGNPRFFMDYMTQMMGVNYKSQMQQYGLMPGQMPTPATGPGLQGFNQIGPSVEFGYSQGPRGTLQMAQDTFNNGELMGSMSAGDMMSVIMQASGAQTQLVQRNIQQSHQARDLAIQNARSIEDINRNGMISLENIHRSYTRQMLIMAQQDEVNKRLNAVGLQELINTAPNLTPEQRDRYNVRLQNEKAAADHLMQFNIRGYLDKNPEDTVVQGYMAQLEAAGGEGTAAYEDIWKNQLMPYIQGKRASLEAQIKTEKDPEKKADLERQLIEIGERPDLAQRLRETQGTALRRDVMRDQNQATETVSLADARRSLGELNFARGNILKEMAEPGKTPEELTKLRMALDSNDASIRATERQITNLTTSLTGSQSVIDAWGVATAESIKAIYLAETSASANAVVSIEENMIQLQNSLNAQSINFKRSVESMQQSWIDAAIEIKRKVPESFAIALQAIQEYSRKSFRAELLYASGDREGAEGLMRSAGVSLADALYPVEYTDNPGDRNKRVYNPQRDEFLTNINGRIDSLFPEMKVGSGGEEDIPEGLKDFAVSVPGGFALRVVSYETKDVTKTDTSNIIDVALGSGLTGDKTDPPRSDGVSK